MSRFECIPECDDCCIYREYYPDVRFGKTGVLILPEEKRRIEKIASLAGKMVRIMPRIGTSEDGAAAPAKILAYQMMGADSNGDTCPFLDDNDGARSPHGGRACSIYEDRPLACRAYPLAGMNLTLDKKCRFCRENKSADSGLDAECEALAHIEEAMGRGGSQIWRYATGTGELEDMHRIRTGWIKITPTVQNHHA